MKTTLSSVSGAMLFSALLLLSTGTEAALILQQGAERISPALEPKSDKTFFGKDYPADKRAVADKHYVFDHPYPAVQDSGDFDRDFVKDENSDGGRWEAQMTYDTLRAKIAGAKDKMNKLKDKMEKEYEDWQRAKKDFENYEDALAKARKEAEAARAAAEAAAKRVNDLEGSSQKDGTKAGGAIGRAIEDVKKEMDDLEKCKEALAKAKKQLKELLKQREVEAEAEAKQKKEEKEKAKKAVEEEEKKKKEKKEKEKTEETEKEKEKAGEKDKKEKPKKKDEEKDEEDWKKEVEEDTKKESGWRKKYLKELEDVRQTEKQLEEAARNLKKFRRPPYVDDNGGVYNVPSESLARMVCSPMAFVMMALTAAIATFA